MPFLLLGCCTALKFCTALGKTPGIGARTCLSAYPASSTLCCPFAGPLEPQVKGQGFAEAINEPGGLIFWDLTGHVQGGLCSKVLCVLVVFLPTSSNPLP